MDYMEKISAGSKPPMVNIKHYENRLPLAGQYKS